MSTTSNCRLELEETARAILDDAIEPLRGVRKIFRILNQIGDTTTPVSMIIRAIESETDFYPDESMRHLYSSVALLRLDEQLDEYISVVRPDLTYACQQILLPSQGS